MAPLIKKNCRAFCGCCGVSYTTAQVHVSGGFRGVCSSRSKSQIWQVIPGFIPAEPEASKTMETPHKCQLFCATAVNGSNTVIPIASNRARSYSYGHYYACVDHNYQYACVVMMYACMRCVCPPCACVRVCGPVIRLLLVGTDTFMSSMYHPHT